MAAKAKTKRRNWTEQEVRAPKKMVKDNALAHQIAASLKRTKAAVYRRVGILGISMRAARKHPIKIKKTG